MDWEQKYKELHEQFKVLETDYKSSQEKCEDLESRGDKRPIIVAREKKPKKFNGKSEDVSVNEWILDMKCYLSGKSMSRQEAVDIVLESLEPPAKTEVRFQLDLNTATADKLLEVLQNTFGVQDNVVQLERKFFERNQRSFESITEYSYVLMELMFPLQKLDQRFKTEQNKYMKDKFADGILDLGLKRELKRINIEQSDLDFWQLRNRAQRWLEDCRVKSHNCNSIDTEPSCNAAQAQTLESLIKLQRQQQDQLNEISKTLTSLKYQKKSYSPRYQSKYDKQGEDGQNKPQMFGQGDRKQIICYYCKGPNHIAKNCVKLQKKNQGKIQVNSQAEELNLTPSVLGAKHWEGSTEAQSESSS
jgi:hypothetical protein